MNLELFQMHPPVFYLEKRASPDYCAAVTPPQTSCLVLQIRRVKMTLVWLPFAGVGGAGCVCGGVAGPAH